MPKDRKKSPEEKDAANGTPTKKDHTGSKSKRKVEPDSESDDGSGRSEDESKQNSRSKKKRSRSSKRRSRRKYSDDDDDDDSYSSEDDYSDSESGSSEYSSEESESEEERRRRKKREEREKERRRRRREKEKKRRRKERDEDKKKKKKKKDKKRSSDRGKKGAVTNSWGKYGIIRETDMWNIMSSSESYGSTSGTSTPIEDDHAPLWSYVTKVENLDGKGGNTKFKCNYCHQDFKGSYFRVKAHLLKLTGYGIRACPKVTPEHLAEMRRQIEEAETRLKMVVPKKVLLPPSTFQSNSMSSGALGTGVFKLDGFESRKKRAATASNALEKAFNSAVREQLHSEIARMFYSAGLSFHLSRNPYYVSAFQFAANNPIPGYVPPSYNLLRTTLLQRERANVERLLEPTKSSWKEKGLSIVSDGWTDSQRRPLINFMGASEAGAVFLKDVNCEGEYKDKFFISNLISQAIEEVGPQNVIQVITDNAPVCSAAGLLIESKYPNIFWTPCVVHTLNLALTNICAPKETGGSAFAYDECHWITLCVDDVLFIKNFIMNHSMRLAMFNEFVPLKLLAVADTRFASAVVILKRFKLIKRGLQSMVISDKWTSYREDNIGSATTVKENLLSDVWWDKMEYILSFTLPIYEMLRFCDTDKPCLHLVYEMWDTMIEKVKTAIFRHEGKLDNEESSFYSVVHSILVERWSKSNTPLHCLAHSLNPRYYSATWLDENSNRVPPHRDEEISSMRNKCLKKYFPNADERRVVNVEYAKFAGCLDIFGDFDSKMDRGILDPLLWWFTHGSPTPFLQSLALKLFSQPCSSSCCERNWSTYSFIHSIKMNKMTPQRAEDLVFVHNNLRLLSRRSRQYMEGDTKLWDVGGDAFDSLEGAGLLEIANLSLDEPDMEAVLFTDEDEGEQVDDVVDIEDLI